MTETATVNWYKERAVLAVKDATAELLAQLALRGEGLAKEAIVDNDQVDTGFMMNSVTAILPGKTPNVPASGEYQSRIGEMVQRNAVPLPEAAEGEAGIGVAADYAIYQEMKQSFLLTALEKLAAEDLKGVKVSVITEALP